ncbi:MAG: hypothetical protein JWQ19_640 [Subtercola sp.]|nr:hypothetical protein [Subtercola sp.]
MDSTLIVVPDPLPQPVVLGARSAGASWPDNSIRVGGLDGYTIRTLGRIGQRIDDAGGVQGLVDDLRSTAALAISELLLSTDHGSATLEDEHFRVSQIHDQSVVLGDQIFDKSVWSVHPMNVDGTMFALWVATRSEGFAAVADLGAVRITMHGSSLPKPLNFSLVPPPGVPPHAE